MADSNHAQIIIQACVDATGTAPPENKLFSKVGKWLRWPDANDKGRATSCALKLHDHGDYYVFVIMNHRAGVKRTGSTRSSKSSLMTPAERAAAKRQRDALERQQRERSARKRRMLAPMAVRLWNNALKPEDWPNQHGYLVRKGIPALNCRRIISPRRDVVVVPMVDLVASELVSLQLIYKSGFKRPLRGTEPNYLCAGVGRDIANAPEIWLAEGYSTSVTLHLETGEPVVMAFNAGNMPNVADVLVQRFPDAKIKVFADDDRATAKKPPRFINPGIEAAKKVQARHPDISLYRPLWPPGAPEGLSDINDLVLWENQQNGGAN